MITTFLVLFNMGNYKKHRFTKDHQGAFNYSIDFYIICTKPCYKGWSDHSYLLSRFMQVFFFALKAQLIKNIGNTLKSETNLKHKKCNLK